MTSIAWIQNQSREEIEAGVMATFLEDPSVFDEYREQVPVESFIGAHHQKLFKFFTEKRDANETWDALTLADTYPERFQFVMDLAVKAQLPALFVEYLKILQCKYFKFQIDNLMADTNLIDPSDIKKFVDNFRFVSARKDERSIDDISHKAIDLAINASKLDLEMPVMFKTLNNHIKGFMRKQIILLMAATSNSKTVFLWNNLIRPIMEGKKVLAYDLEMPEEFLFYRMVAMWFRVPLRWMTDGRQVKKNEKLVQWQQDCMAERMAEMSVRIKDNLIIRGACGLDQVERDIINFQPDIVSIDTIQAFCSKQKKPNGMNNADHITVVCAKFFDLIKGYNVAGIYTAQVNRSTDGKIPGLGSVKESGGPEDNAAVVIGLRDKFFITGDDEQVDEYDVNVCKNRNGETILLHFKMNKPIARVSDTGKMKSLEDERGEYADHLTQHERNEADGF